MMIESQTIVVDDGICPQCGELLVYPRGGKPYCEDCGWPDEDFDEPVKEDS